MKTYKLIALAMFPLALFASCAGDEDMPLPENHKFDNAFAVDDAATGLDAEVRRNFHKDTGIYLLFNDTLRTYTDDFGIERTELFDFNFNMVGQRGTALYRYSYLPDSQKEKTAHILKENLVPVIADGRFRPFSIVALKDLTGKQYDSDYYPWNIQYNIENFRGQGIRADELVAAETPEEIELAVKQIVKSMINGKITFYEPELDDFYAPSAEYFGLNLLQTFPDWATNKDMQKLYDRGFINYTASWNVQYDVFNSKLTDFQAYTNAVFDRSEADFRNEFGQYPVIMKRYGLFIDALARLGVKLKK